MVELLGYGKTIVLKKQIDGAIPNSHFHYERGLILGYGLKTVIYFALEGLNTLFALISLSIHRSLRHSGYSYLKG